jgi:hypothetical protein
MPTGSGGVEEEIVFFARLRPDGKIALDFGGLWEDCAYDGARIFHSRAEFDAAGYRYPVEFVVGQDVEVLSLEHEARKRARESKAA